MKLLPLLIAIALLATGCTTTSFNKHLRHGDRWDGPITNEYTSRFGTVIQGRSPVDTVKFECGQQPWSPGAIKITLEDGSSKIYECEDVRNGKL